MNNLKKVFEDHTFLSLYIPVFLLILIGLITTSGFNYLHYVFSFFGALLISYSLFYRFDILRFPLKLNIQVSKIWITILLVSCIALTIFHFIALGGIPGLEGIQIRKLSEVVNLRKDIGQRAHPIWGYLSSINMKALIPFTLFLCLLQNRKKEYWTILILGIFYSTALMQKSHVLSVLFPVIIFAILNKKWLLVTKYAALTLFVIFSLVYITNPQLRGGEYDLKYTEESKKIAENKSNDPAVVKAVKSIFKRVIVVPGKMVSEWFRIIPNEKPFLNGNGYKIGSKINGETFHDYSKELHPLVFPEYGKQGIQGTVNVAHFMREYSNFGSIGLVLSGVFTALFFIFLNHVFRDISLVNKLAFNSFPIFLMSSGSLTTILLTGGWFFTILLFFIFKNFFEREKHIIP
jgi:hypothetical protein